MAQLTGRHNLTVGHKMCENHEVRQKIVDVPCCNLL